MENSWKSQKRDDLTPEKTQRKVSLVCGWRYICIYDCSLDEINSNLTKSIERSRKWHTDKREFSMCGAFLIIRINIYECWICQIP